MKFVCGAFRLSLGNFENNRMDRFFQWLLKEVMDLATVVEKPFPFGEE